MSKPKTIVPTNSNLPQEKHSGGRPALFDTPEALESKVEEYFQIIKQEQKVDSNRTPGIAELTYFLGFESRQSLYDQTKRNPMFSYIVKRARLRCQAMIEQALSEEKANPTKHIYKLNAMGYQKDSQESHSTRISGPINIILTNEKPNLKILENDEYEVVPDEN